jgi:hypothetical protein
MPSTKKRAEYALRLATIVPESGSVAVERSAASAVVAGDTLAVTVSGVFCVIAAVGVAAIVAVTTLAVPAASVGNAVADGRTAGSGVSETDVGTGVLVSAGCGA